MRSRSNAFLAWITVLSPALIGASVAIYEVNDFKSDSGLGGIAMPSWMPGWLLEFNNELLFRASGWPILSTIYGFVDDEVGYYAFAALTWWLVFLVPVLAWGWYLGWWTDRGLERRGSGARWAAWIVAVPGIVLGFAAMTVAVIVLLIAIVVIYVAAKSFGGNSNAPDTAINRSGNVLQKNRWTGEYEEKRDMFGNTATDKDVFGRPNTDRDWKGTPKQVQGDAWQSPPRSPSGDELYERKSKGDERS